MMKSVNVYYAGIAAKNNKPEKRQVLEYFHKGVPGNQSTEIYDQSWRPSDLAVIQGWVHDNSNLKSPHLRFRKHIIEQQKNINKHVLAIDSNLFLYRDVNNTKNYLRFSLDDVFPKKGNYFIDDIDPNRWKQIKSDLNINLMDWRKKGDHILICMQRNGGWSMKGIHVMDWCHRTINEIKKYTDRPIVIRAHPGDKKAKNYLRFSDDVKVSKSPSLLEDLDNAWATITYNSSPGVASAIEGVPVFVTDTDPCNSQAYDVANCDLSLIESPLMPDRQKWIEKISMSHFNFQDLKQGIAWEIIEKYI